MRWRLWHLYARVPEPVRLIIVGSVCAGSGAAVLYALMERL